MLKASVTARLWTGGRCEQSGYLGPNLCPVCQRCHGTIRHRTYDCAAIQADLPQRLLQTHRGNMARELCGEEPAAYL